MLSSMNVPPAPPEIALAPTVIEHLDDNLAAEFVSGALAKSAITNLCAIIFSTEPSDESAHKKADSSHQSLDGTMECQTG